MMKKTFVAAMALMLSVGAFAQSEKYDSPYDFKDVKSNSITGARNQQRAGTCWSYGTLAMIESDIIKNGNGEHNLSEMWIVRNTYYEKIVKFVRMHGHNNLGQGGNAHDVTNIIAKYGLVPQEAYRGLNYGTDVHTHGEVDAVLTAYANAVVKNPNKTLSTAWLEGINGILDAYFGPRPEKFTYQGKEYTPQSFAQEMGIDGNEYVSFTSFEHHPYYTAFPLEIPDNWAWEPSYNVPLDEFVAILDEGIEKGYTASWAADVSEKGFAYAKGFAVLPQTEVAAMDNLEQARWVKMDEADRESEIYKFEEIVPEIKVTPELRQLWFDNYQTTDDHGMQIYGIAKDKKGNKFYKVKNSWGTDHVLKGCFYTSEPFFMGKTTNYLINKNALSQATKDKLGIK